ncbi:MAG: hypothetical protein K0S76_760 [Herbinix sp.]|jgi:hypothetical protein|nr:hypothetical protein [Herbinix sp.]
MASAKMKLIDIRQDSSRNNIQIVTFLPTNTILGEFFLSNKASSTKNAELVKKIGLDFENYLLDIMKQG